MDYKPCKSLYNKDLIGVYRIIVESNGKHKFHFHNAGVGGSSPPITTIYSKGFSVFSLSPFFIGLPLGYRWARNRLCVKP